MTHRTDLSRGRDIVARWCALAEQRLDHLTELFETGRWRRYHGEMEFLENIREAKAAVETWRNLLTREASLDNAAIDLSWLGRRREVAPPRSEAPANRAFGLSPTPAAIAPTLPVAAIGPELQPVLAEAPSAARRAEALEQTAALALDIVAMQERYPLLRNAL